MSTHTNAVLAALLLGGALAAGSLSGQSVAAQAKAAAVRTPAVSQTFATATLPLGGGMSHADADGTGLGGTLDANGLEAITTGQTDLGLVSATASAEAADVNILNGLIAAKAVLALATSYANAQTATSEANGSTLLGLVVNGVAYADGAPNPNTQVVLPGVGYAVLNEQTTTGDGVHASGLVLTMIHVYLIDPVTGATRGEIVVGTARTSASL